MNKELIRPLGESCSIRDESLFFGHAFSISTPQSAEEVAAIIKHCRTIGEQITPHGGLTGINGAGIPSNNHTMNLQHLSSVAYREDDHTLWAEAGATFSDIETEVYKASNREYEFPASPTEKSATIGGALSFGAHGLRSYKYGSVSDYVTEIEYCDCYGKLHLCKVNPFESHDLFGSEGMCAVITGVRLRTVPIPQNIWGLMIFFPSSLYAAQFSDAIADEKLISVLEFCDKNSFDLVEEYRSQMNSISRIPSIPSENPYAIYLELESDDEESLELTAERLLELTDQYHGDSENIWTVVGDEIKTLRLLRHAISECINLKIAYYHTTDVRVKKLSVSCFFPHMTRAELLTYYQKHLDAHKLHGIIFGHIGTKKPYVNIITTSSQEYCEAKALIEQWCKDAYTSGGSAFSECGVGKLYRRIFCHTAPIDLINRHVKIKHKWDPIKLFNPENMFINSQL